MREYDTSMHGYFSATFRAHWKEYPFSDKLDDYEPTGDEWEKVESEIADQINGNISVDDLKVEADYDGFVAYFKVPVDGNAHVYNGLDHYDSDLEGDWNYEELDLYKAEFLKLFPDGSIEFEEPDEYEIGEPGESICAEDFYDDYRNESL